MSLFLLITYIILSILVLLTSVEGSVFTEDNSFKKAYSGDTSLFFSILLILAFSLFCATRTIYSYDTEVYCRWFNKLMELPRLAITNEYGILFEYISKIIGYLAQGRFRIYLFLLSVLTNSAIYTIIRRNHAVPDSCFIIYIYYIAFYYNFAVIRQGLAFVFVLWAFLHWDSKPKSIGMLLIAALIHNSAWIVVCAVVVITVVQLNKRMLITVWIIALANYITRFSDRVLETMVVFFKDYIPKSMAARYELYFGSIASGGINISLYYLFYFAIVLALIWFTDESMHFSNNEAKNESLKMLNVGMTGIIVLSLGASFSVITRISDYFILPCIVMMLPIIAGNLYYRKTKYAFIIGLCSVVLILSLRVFTIRAPIFI